MAAVDYIKRWVLARVLPLSWLDYMAIAAAAIGVLDEVLRWLSG